MQYSTKSCPENEQFCKVKVDMDMQVTKLFDFRTVKQEIVTIRNLYHMNTHRHIMH